MAAVYDGDRARQIGALALVAAVLLAACSRGGGSGEDRSSSPAGPATARGTTLVTEGPDTSAGSAPTPAPRSEVAVRPAVDPVGVAQPGSLVTADGRTRTYRTYVPSTPPTDQPAPLLVALHGGTGWGAQFERSSGFDGLAEANGFVVVYPDGIGAGPDETALRTWNGGGCCGNAVRQGVDDVAFLVALVDEIAGQRPIDRDRVFMVGHSNGGIMAYRVACERADVVAAVAVQSSTLELASCSPSAALSLLHIHGTADEHLPIEGGRGAKSLAGVDFRPVRPGVERVAAAIGCPDEPTVERRPANSDVEVTTWTPCPAGTEVQLVLVEGASHAWMGHPAQRPEVVGEPYQGLDATEETWRFLVNHPRRSR